MYYVITFPTTHLALKYDKTIKKNGLNSKLIPVPRKLSSNCGFCGQVYTKKELFQILELCSTEGIKVESAYAIPEDRKKAPERIQVGQLQ